MRSAVIRLEQPLIPNGDAVLALARILTEMNGSVGPDGCPSDHSFSGATGDEALGFQIEASAILDQLAAKGFVISKPARNTSLGPKVRDAAPAIPTSY